MGTISADVCTACTRRNSPCPKCLRDIVAEDRQRGRKKGAGWQGLIGNSYAKKDEPLSPAGEKAKRKQERKAAKQEQSSTLATLPTCKCRDCRTERRITHYWQRGLSLSEATEVAASEDDYSEDSMP